MVQSEEIRSSFFLPKLSSYHIVDAGETSAECPSNIALVKYWGKKEIQIPCNSSISYSLSKSRTVTKLRYTPKAKQGYDIKIFLDGEEKPNFLDKILTFFERIQPFMPFLQSYAFEIHTHNTFPHSTGIASSASGIGALTLALMQLEAKISEKVSSEDYFRKASFLSRLGSGSACRSIYNGLVYWGENPLISGANKRFAIPYPNEIHPIFKDFRDTILLIDSGEKKVKSSAGHSLMDLHPFAEGRYEMSEKHIEDLIPILASGDLEGFGKIVEREALTLHSLMLSSAEPFILMKPASVEAVNKVWSFRKETGLPLFFTLDAGANLHLLYPENSEKAVDSFIEKELLSLCSNEGCIRDIIKF